MFLLPIWKQDSVYKWTERNWFNHYLHHEINFFTLRIHQASNWTQLNAPKTGSAYLLIWYQFISALWAIKQANPRWPDKILLRWILQYWTCPDYYTKNIEHVIRRGWCWNGEVHSPITLSWPSAYPGHTGGYAWLSGLGKTHSDARAGP